MVDQPSLNVHDFGLHSKDGRPSGPQWSCCCLFSGAFTRNYGRPLSLRTRLGAQTSMIENDRTRAGNRKTKQRWISRLD